MTTRIGPPAGVSAPASLGGQARGRLLPKEYDNRGMRSETRLRRLIQDVGVKHSVIHIATKVPIAIRMLHPYLAPL